MRLSIEVFRGTQRIAALELPVGMIELEKAREIWEFEQALNEHTQARFHVNLVGDGDERMRRNEAEV